MTNIFSAEQKVWRLLRCISGSEEKIAWPMHNWFNIPVYYPQAWAYRRQAGSRNHKKIRVPIFSGYLFSAVLPDKDESFRLKNRGYIGPIRIDGNIALVPDEEISFLKQRELDGEFDMKRENEIPVFEEGDRIELLSEMWLGKKATVSLVMADGAKIRFYVDGSNIPVEDWAWRARRIAVNSSQPEAIPIRARSTVQT